MKTLGVYDLNIFSQTPNIYSLYDMENMFYQRLFCVKKNKITTRVIIEVKFNKGISDMQFVVPHF